MTSAAESKTCDNCQYRYVVEQLESSLDEVAEKWAIAQVNYEDCAKRNTLLEVLVQDWCDLYENPDYGDCVRLRNRMKRLGLLRDDAE